MRDAVTPRQFLGVELQGQPRGGSVATKMENCSDTVLHPFSITTSPALRAVVLRSGLLHLLILELTQSPIDFYNVHKQKKVFFDDQSCHLK